MLLLLYSLERRKLLRLLKGEDERRADWLRCNRPPPAAPDPPSEPSLNSLSLLVSLSVSLSFNTRPLLCCEVDAAALSDGRDKEASASPKPDRLGEEDM